METDGKGNVTYTAIPAKDSNAAPIPENHSRFYCSKCQMSYDLPDKATSWRCSNCHEFNSIVQGEMERCTIM